MATEGHFYNDSDPILQQNRIALDEAVRKYTAENLERPGVVTGWVLSVGTSRFDDEGNVAQGFDYSIGPDTNLPLSVGLLELSLWELRSHVLDRHNNEGDNE